MLNYPLPSYSLKETNYHYESIKKAIGEHALIFFKEKVDVGEQITPTFLPKEKLLLKVPPVESTVPTVSEPSPDKPQAEREPEPPKPEEQAEEEPQIPPKPKAQFGPPPKKSRLPKWVRRVLGIERREHLLGEVLDLGCAK